MNKKNLKSAQKNQIFNIKALLIFALFFFGMLRLQGQTLSFSISRDTIFENNIITLKNLSTGFTQTDQFKWEFDSCIFIESGKIVSGSIYTRMYDTLIGRFTNFISDSVKITITPYDSIGNQIGTNSYSMLYIALSTNITNNYTADSCYQYIDTCMNLVCNGDFNFLKDTVVSTWNIGQNVPPWNNGGNSPDLLSSFDNTVPYNVFGYQSDHSNPNGIGNYVGIIAYWPINPSFKEHIFQELQNELISGQRYNVEWYASLGESSGFACNSIQALFSDTIININAIGGGFNGTNNYYLVSPLAGSPLSDTLNWVKISQIFIPNSKGLKYLTIGNFYPDSIIVLDTLNNNSISQPSYYFLDDFKVEPLPPILNISSNLNNNNIICSPGDTVKLYANAIGDSLLLWSTGSAADSIMVAPLTDTFYTVTAYDYTLCHSTTDTVFIYVAQSNIKPNVLLNDAFGCQDIDTVLLNVQGIGAHHYLWNTGDTTSSIFVVTNGQTQNFSVLVSGQYPPCSDTTLYAQVFSSIIIPSPNVTGNLNSCDTILTYRIHNFDNLFQYSWTFNDSIFFPLNDSILIIDCNDYPQIYNGDTLIIKINDTICNQFNINYFPIIPCCINSDIDLFLNHKDSLNLNHSNYNLSNQRIEFNDLQISINDTLYIDANTRFYKCDIDMGPYATIYFRGGDTLIFDNTNIGPCDTIMWNSVVIPNATQYIYSNSCIISYGTEAFKIENGAASYFTNNTFENNHRSLVIKNYNPLIPSPLPINYTMPNAYSGVFYNNTINGTSNYLYFPLHYYKSYSGVDLQNVYGFKVGNAQNASLTNSFKNLEFGIRAFNSQFEVHNASFDSINPSSAGAGIWAGGSFCHSGAVVGFNTVSGSVANPNPPSYVSVISPSVSATNNTVTHSSLGIYASFSRIDARNNDIHAIHNGIVAHEPRGNSQIKNNTIEVTHFIQTYLQTEYTGIGILANRVMEQISQMNISDNTINNPVKTGIWVENLNSTSWQVTNGLRTVVGNNKVVFTTGIYPANSWQHYGIRMNNCDRAIIGFNQIENQGVVSAYYWDKQRGISLSDCKDARVYSNYPIYNIGTGIRAVGNNINTQFYCNSITNAYNGFYFEHGAGIATYISDQGNTEWATDNTWNNMDTTQGRKRMGGKNNLSGNPNFWHFRGNGGVDMQIFNPQIPLNSLFNLKLFGMPGNSSPSICPQPSPNPSDPTQSISFEELRDHYFGEIVREEIEFEVLAEEFGYFNGEYFFEEMDEYSDWLTLGTWDDTIYQNFYNYLFNSNIGEFSQVVELMENGSIDEAIYQNSGIIPGNIIEVNEQFVNEMYLTYYLNDTIPPVNELQTLENIALLTPWVGGEAVYTARILLGIDPDNHGIAYRLQKDSTASTKIDKVLLYPNPTNSNITIQFTNKIEGNIDIKVIDILGKIFVEENYQAKNTISVNLGNLKSGVYNILIYSNNNLYETKSFIKY